MEEIIFKTKIDFKALEQYRDANNDDLPITGFISIYRAIGLLDALIAYRKDHPDFQLCPLDHIFCNISTNKRLKALIEDNWSTFSLDIDSDNHVYWDTKKYPKGTKHYKKKIKAVPKASISQDFIDYCPGIDDDLGVNEIVFMIITPDEKTAEA